MSRTFALWLSRLLKNQILRIRNLHHLQNHQQFDVKLSVIGTNLLPLTCFINSPKYSGAKQPSPQEAFVRATHQPTPSEKLPQTRLSLLRPHSRNPVVKTSSESSSDGLENHSALSSRDKSSDSPPLPARKVSSTNSFKYSYSLVVINGSSAAP